MLDGGAVRMRVRWYRYYVQYPTEAASSTKFCGTSRHVYSTHTHTHSTCVLFSFSFVGLLIALQMSQEQLSIEGLTSIV